VCYEQGCTVYIKWKFQTMLKKFITMSRQTRMSQCVFILWPFQKLVGKRKKIPVNAVVYYELRNSVTRSFCDVPK